MVDGKDLKFRVLQKMIRKILQLTLLIFTSLQVEAQSIKEKTLDISIGLGLSSPYEEDVDVIDDGFYLQGEYVLVFSKWFDVRPYAGGIFTKSSGVDSNQNPTEYKATSNALLIGGKARVTIPIPWIAPYFELGIGASIGSFKTITPSYDIEKTGIIPHIPFSLGLELGPKHNYDLGLTYYFQPSVEHYAGAFAFGLSIPIDD